ncbi:uncharacterized protein LOC117101470, partial [Anneissia japonica]|uniref:uncharacterized protein LOC117101470 n=1 Tax=Anneissia japonica TaxID=1529436 RepID=UPI001425B029
DEKAPISEVSELSIIPEVEECAPYFTKELETKLIAVEGDSAAILQCAVAGIPRPQVTWYVDNIEIIDVPEYIVKHTEEGICELHIQECIPEDEGFYTCKAVNHLGEVTCTAQLLVEGYLRHYVANMFYKKKCYIKDEVLVKEKEREKEYSIEPSFLTSGQGMDGSHPSISQELTRAGDFKYGNHIEDICNSLRMFSHHMIPHEKVITDEQIVQLMSKRISWRNKQHLITTVKMLLPEYIGKIFAHVLIAVQDEQDVLQEIHEVYTDDIVSSLSAECKNLNLKYDIIRYYLYFNSITVSFLIHLLCNAPRLEELELVYCNITGVTLNEIADTLLRERIVLKLIHLDISVNNLSDIKCSSLASLLAVTPNLSVLEMRQCSLSGAIMDDIVIECSNRGIMLELTHFNISINNLKEIKGSSLATLLAVAPKLNCFYISNCSLPGAVIDDMVKECSSRGVVLELTDLNISVNNFNKIKGSSLATLVVVLASKLNYLYMSNCCLSCVIMNDIVKECSSRGVVLELTCLVISENNLKDIKGSSLAALLALAPKLNYLDMRKCGLSGAIMDDMVKESSSRGVVLELTHLFINENNLIDIKGSSLPTLLVIAPKLNFLDLNNCNLSCIIMDDIVKECCSREVALKLADFLYQ